MGKAPNRSTPRHPAKPKTKKKSRSRGPRWARLCAIFGALLMMLSGGLLVGGQMLLARFEGAVNQQDLFDASDEPTTDLKGPLNILLVGIDPRASNPNTRPLADSIMIMHIPASLDRAYLFSLPRDLLVDIPPFPEAGYRGGRDRINASMSHGSITPGNEPPNAAQGFKLLSRTVSAYTGIERFDAGAIINFNGFKSIVKELGGVTMYIDEDVSSEHLAPDGSARPRCRGGDHPYCGPAKEYKKGRHHLNDWEALDYVRQRYTVSDGDYGRQRHQRQFIRAVVEQAMSKDVVTNPVKLDKVIRAAGKSLIFDGRGHKVVDFGLALRNIRPDSILALQFPHSTVYGSNGKYAGESLGPEATEFFYAIRTEQVDNFLINHQELISAS